MTLADAVRSDAGLVRVSTLPGLTLAVALAALMLAGCGDGTGSPTAEIKAWVEAAEGEAENRDRRALMARVSANYADARGNDREAIGNLLRYVMLRQQRIALVTGIEDIRLFGGSAAEVELTAAMAGSKGALDLSGEVYRFELELEKVDGDWQLIGARWGQFRGELR